MEDKIGGEESGGRERWRRCGKIGMDLEVEEMWDGKRRDVGRQQKICGTTEMAKWVGRTAMDWANINRERLPT